MVMLEIKILEITEKVVLRIIEIVANTIMAALEIEIIRKTIQNLLTIIKIFKKIIKNLSKEKKKK